MKNKAINVTTGAVIVCGGLVVLAAGVLSYSALYDLFLAMGLFHPYLAFLFPLLFDMAEVTAALVVWNHHLRGKRNTLAWKWVIWFTVLGVGANVAHAGFAHLQDKIDFSQMILAMVLTSLFPISVALITHLLKQTIDLHVAQTEKGQGKQETDVQKMLNEANAVLAELNKHKEDAPQKELKKQVVYETVAAQAGLSYGDISEQTDIPRSTVRDYVGEFIADGEMVRNGSGLEVAQ